MGNVGLGLVVIVIGDKIFHGVVGEELPELAAKLGRQGFVVGQNQGGAVQLFDDGGHGEGLAGTGDAQQRLLPQSPIHAVCQGGDGLRLVAGGLIFGYELKLIHTFSHQRAAPVHLFLHTFTR